MSAAEIIKKFNALQTERVETYQLFEEGHAAYLQGAPNYNFPMYRQLVHEITETFQKISGDIVLIIEKLKQEGQTNIIVHCMEKIQDEEKKKLEVTVKRQLSKQSAIDHPDEVQHSQEVAEHEKCLAEIRETINECLEELKYESEDLMEPPS